MFFINLFVISIMNIIKLWKNTIDDISSSSSKQYGFGYHVENIIKQILVINESNGKNNVSENL